MKIIITAAGLGSRFTKEGIAKPKYEIIAKGKSLFYLSIISLKKYFDDEFIFIFNIRSFNSEFIKRELYFLGIRKYQIILIDYLTSGQACTAFLAEKYVSPDEGVIIFNIDTHIDPEALEEMDLDNCDGLIPVFKVEGEHWSFVKTLDGTPNTPAVQVSEKVRISDMASVGLYYFKKWADFKIIIKRHQKDIKNNFREVYIAPMYQYLIDQKKEIYAFLINKDDVTPLGTPAEVEAYDAEWLKNNK